jgi:hypothetical protein
MDQDQVNDFDNYYTLKLQPSIARLSKEKWQTRYWKYIGIACPFLVIVLLCNLSSLDSSLIICFRIAIALLLIISVYMYSKEQDIFVEDYKASIVKGIISYVNSSYIYLPDKSITHTDYINSSLYRYGYDSIWYRFLGSKRIK